MMPKGPRFDKRAGNRAAGPCRPGSAAIYDIGPHRSRGGCVNTLRSGRMNVVGGRVRAEPTQVYPNARFVQGL